MGKFAGPSVKGGQSSILQEIAAQAEAEVPVQVEEEAVAETVEQPPVAPSAPPAAAIAEEVGQDALERDVVPTIQQRATGEAAPVKWMTTPPPVFETDGGVKHRAEQVVAKFRNNNAWEGGLAFSPGQATGLNAVIQKMGAMTGQEKVLKPDGSAGFNTTLDDAFLAIGAVVTENVVTRLGEGQPPVPTFQQEKIEDEGPAPIKNEVTKSQANVEIGREINREYQRQKNAQLGQPLDQYQDLSADEAAVLGDAFKEMYAAANPGDFKRVPASELGGQVTFQLLPEGETRISQPAAKARRAALFPGVNVRPSKTPIQGSQLPTEVGRVATRKATGKIKKNPVDNTVIDEAMQNLAKVPNVVNPRRMKILFATALPALMGMTGFQANINSIGDKQVQKFNAEAKRAEREGEVYDPAASMETIKRSLAQNIRAIAMERKGANYLSYYAQNFNGRIAPQQSFFDPTTSKAVRFVTTNAVPAKATPGSRIDRNLRQMYAMMLVKDADADLPEGREQKLQQADPKLRAWGKRLIEVLDATMTDEQMEAVADAIQQGIPMTDPNFPQFGEFTLDPERDADLIQAIDKKGEDGLAFIDGVIDYAQYAEARDQGKPYFSYFNAYMDGKTNGIASNGIQMGSRDVAFKTGVLRTNPTRLLDNDMDTRDALMAAMNEEIETTGIQTNNPNLYTVMKGIANYRQLAKDTTMTYGYGKELESFEADIDEAIDLISETDPEVAAAMEALMADGDRKSIVESVWTTYTNHLGGAISEEAMEARPLMRAAATLHALMDKVFSLKTATDFDLHLGGEVTTGFEGATEQTYGIHEGGKKREVHAVRYGTRSTAAAPKGDQGPGSRAYGGSLPGPVQSIDAATVALTASGKSWDKLRSASNGNPYLHSIYDAFKVDAMGYDVVLDEVNQNWLDAGMNWSYLQSTLDATTEAVKDFNEEIKAYPDSLPILTGATDEFAMFGHLTAVTPSKTSGKLGPWNLTTMLMKMIDRKPGQDGDQFFFDTLKTARTMIKEMEDMGYNAQQPTIRDLKNFMKLLSREVRLQPRLQAMINKTNKNKENLKKEIKAAGVPVYQYYAH